MTSDSVPVRRTLVGAVLRDHRETAGYTLDDAAEVLRCDRSKISRIETGQRGISPRELRELLAEYGGDDHEQQTIIELARRIRKGWWDEYRDILPDDLLDQVTAEPLADEILIYEPQNVPELLQTRGYALAIAAANPALASDKQRERAVRAVKGRQGVLLGEQPPKLTIVIGEAALRQRVGADDVMREQLRLLADVSAKFPSVTLRVLPFTAGAYTAIRIGPVSVLRFRGMPSFAVIHQTGMFGSAFVVRSTTLALVLRKLELLHGAALTPEESRHLIGQINEV
jgi:transcriptional regulator with XRE-family HTH domain